MTTGPVARIPLSILEDASLLKAEAWTFIALYSFADDRGECWPSLDRIASRAHLTRRCVVDSLRNLESKKLIERTRRFERNSREPTSTRYRVLCRESGSLGSESSSLQVGNTIPYVGNGMHLGREPGSPELINELKKDTLSSPLSSKSKKAVKEKPEALSPDQLAAYHAAESRFQDTAKTEGVTWNHPRQGKALRSLVEAYTDRLASLPGIVETFLTLRGGKETFWTKQPPTASALLALLDRVETEAAKRRPPAPDRKPLPTCPVCRSTYPVGSQICPRCGFFLDDAKGPRAETAIAAHRTRITERGTA